MKPPIMDNSTIAHGLPELPSYTLTPRPDMIPGVSDLALHVVVPLLTYWVVSTIFQILDSYDLCAAYRLHTPAELLKRNHVTKYEVFRDVLLQQIVQAVFAYGMGLFDGPNMVGDEEYRIAVWALRVRRVERLVPGVLAVLGLNAHKIAAQLHSTYPTLAAVLAGGQYSVDGFAQWELSFGHAMYWFIIPVLQVLYAIVHVDTWQYFLHRAMHMNKFLYTWLHARHHRLYVPYAFGALYNHPIEGFILDTLGAGTAYLITGMTLRQGMWFFSFSTVKTIDDHCGYAFPWDPLQHVTSNNASYHDIHHQSWGIKVNFSQPYFTFWDRVLGTSWTGGDVSARYARDRLLAQKKVDADNVKNNTMATSITNSPATDLDKAAKQVADSRQQFLEQSIDPPAQILREEAQEEAEAQREVQQSMQNVRRSPRRRQSGFDAKSLSDKVSGSLYGRRTPILHADGVH